jgi:hypothetical protein
MDYVLPPDIAQDAELRGNEYGWSISSFLDAVAKAEARGYACWGGQFQFRLDHGATCEMYWLSADSSERLQDESWSDYSRRSCSEVLSKFQQLVSTIDFAKQVSSWPLPINSERDLVFEADFVTEAGWAELSARILQSKQK